MAAAAASRDTEVRFGETPWSVVVAAGATTEPRAQAALTEVCRVYWRPIYADLRRSGHNGLLPACNFDCPSLFG